MRRGLSRKQDLTHLLTISFETVKSNLDYSSAYIYPQPHITRSDTLKHAQTPYKLKTANQQTSNNTLLLANSRKRLSFPLMYFVSIRQREMTNWLKDVNMTF